MPVPFLAKACNGLSCVGGKRTGAYSKFVHQISTARARNNFEHISPYLTGRILDVGVGTGALSCELLRQGHQVDGVDVDDFSIYSDIRPRIYDGRGLPYYDGAYDTAILIMVLHHCKDPLLVLQEAKRVAKRVIFIEDTFRNFFEMAVVSVGDMIANFEFYPHLYFRTHEWKSFIRYQGWKIVSLKEWSRVSYGFLYSRYCMFVVE